MEKQDTNPWGAAPTKVAQVMLHRYEAALKAQAEKGALGAGPAENAVLKNDMTLKKLIKMVYVAHGYHLAICGTPLIRGRIEAWDGGPVIPEIFYDAKALGVAGSRLLPHNLFELLAMHLSPLEGFVSKRSKGVVDAVIRAFGANSDDALSYATHLPGTPWRGAYEKGRRNLIDNNVIWRFYAARYKADVAIKGL